MKIAQNDHPESVRLLRLAAWLAHILVLLHQGGMPTASKTDESSRRAVRDVAGVVESGGRSDEHRTAEIDHANPCANRSFRRWCCSGRPTEL